MNGNNKGVAVINADLGEIFHALAGEQRKDALWILLKYISNDEAKIIWGVVKGQTALMEKLMKLLNERIKSYEDSLRLRKIFWFIRSKSIVQEAMELALNDFKLALTQILDLEEFQNEQILQLRNKLPEKFLEGIKDFLNNNSSLAEVRNTLPRIFGRR